MGGGDLNMKKHFHPLTMQNLERVWKAEQKAKEEAQKLEQLQKELEEERRREALQQHAVEQGIIKKKNQKLDWMYAGPQVNHEEYLLGKKIDKNVEVLKEEKQQDVGASYIPEISDPVKDMAAKIKEDPLFLIRKKEEESKKELIQNPIKLRKLKEMLNMSVSDKRKHKKSKKNKKEKRKKEKRGRRQRYESESGSEIESYEDRRVRRDSREDGRYDERNGIRDKKLKIKERKKESRDRHGSDGESETDNDGEKNKRIAAYKEKRYAERDGRRGDSAKEDDMKSRPKRRNDRSESHSSDGNERGHVKGRRFEERRYRDTKNGEARGKEGRILNGEGKRRDRFLEMDTVDRRRDRKHEHKRQRSPHYEEDRKISGIRKSERKRETSGDEESDLEVKRPKRNHSNKVDDLCERRHSGIVVQGARNYGLIHPKGEPDRYKETGEKTMSAKGTRYDSKRSHRLNGDIESRKNPKTKHDSSSNSSPERLPSSSGRERNRRRNDDSESDSSYAKKNNKKAPAPPSRLISTNVSRKLTAEELEKKRQEMMENAKWRDDQRGKNIKKYKLEDEKEENEVKDRMKGSEAKAKFIHELQVKSYSSSSTASVEDRIKRNIYTKQRTHDALNKKFTEK